MVDFLKEQRVRKMQKAAEAEAEEWNLLRKEAGYSLRTGWNACPILPLDEALLLKIEPCHCYVYKLDIGGVSYVGFTTLSPPERVKFHIADAKNGSQLPVHSKLRQFGYLFDLEVLASEENEILGLVREVSFIKKMAPELNVSCGGEGNDIDLFFQRNDIGEDVLFVKNKKAIRQNELEDATIEQLKAQKIADENARLASYEQEKIDAAEQRERSFQEGLAKLRETDFDKYLSEQQKRANLNNLKGGKYKKENHKWVVDSDGELIHQYQKPQSNFLKKLFS